MCIDIQKFSSISSLISKGRNPLTCPSSLACCVHSISNICSHCRAMGCFSSSTGGQYISTKRCISRVYNLESVEKAWRIFHLIHRLDPNLFALQQRIQIKQDIDTDPSSLLVQRLDNFPIRSARPCKPSIWTRQSTVGFHCDDMSRDRENTS